MTTFQPSTLIISTTGANVRVSPGGPVIAVAPPNTPATVLSGPITHDNLPWYQVRGGWVAQHSHTQTLWEPLANRVQLMYADQRFADCVRTVLGIEGGLTTEEEAAQDLGGMTNFGISQRSHPYVVVERVT